MVLYSVFYVNQTKKKMPIRKAKGEQNEETVDKKGSDICTCSKIQSGIRHLDLLFISVAFAGGESLASATLERAVWPTRTSSNSVALSFLQSENKNNVTKRARTKC